MAYDNRLKVNPEIFTSTVLINVGGPFTLTPIYHQILKNEAALYVVNSKSDDVKKYLPFVHADTEEKAQKILLDFLGCTAFKQSLLLCIRLQKMPVGYIDFRTPISSKELNDWSVDFWLGEPMRSKGIMAAALSNGLLYLQEYEVPRVVTAVDKNNFISIKVLETVGFALVGETASNGLLYSVGL